MAPRRRPGRSPRTAGAGRGEWISVDIDIDGCTPAAIAAALPPTDGLDDESVEIAGDWYGPFAEYGWLKLDPERVDLSPRLPVYDVVLFSMRSSEEGGFTSGSVVGRKRSVEVRLVGFLP